MAFVFPSTRDCDTRAAAGRWALVMKFNVIVPRSISHLSLVCGRLQTILVPLRSTTPFPGYTGGGTPTGRRHTGTTAGNVMHRLHEQHLHVRKQFRGHFPETSVQSRRLDYDTRWF